MKKRNWWIPVSISFFRRFCCLYSIEKTTLTKQCGFLFPNDIANKIVKTILWNYYVKINTMNTTSSTSSINQLNTLNSIFLPWQPPYLVSDSICAYVKEVAHLNLNWDWMLCWPGNKLPWYDCWKAHPWTGLLKALLPSRALFILTKQTLLYTIQSPRHRNYILPNN